MYLLDLAKKSKTPHSTTLSSAIAPRFRVSSCPWLKGRITRWSSGSVTVKYDIPNKPWDNDHIAPDADAPEASVGNYSGTMSISPRTEVTEL